MPPKTVILLGDELPANLTLVTADSKGFHPGYSVQVLLFCVTFTSAWGALVAHKVMVPTGKNSQRKVALFPEVVSEIYQEGGA